jgi:hypothetical protein
MDIGRPDAQLALQQSLHLWQVYALQSLLIEMVFISHGRIQISHQETLLVKRQLIFQRSHVLDGHIRHLLYGVVAHGECAVGWLE